jgi:two-component system sensor histidine kinase HydH
MFDVHSATTGNTFRWAMVGLFAFSLAALGVTVWIMVDFLQEQVIVQELTKKLQPEDAAKAELLAGELRWQFRLATLVVLNLIVTGIVMVLLWRAYHTSQESLRDVKAQASDILSSMDQAVITTDSDGKILSINRCGIEMLELPDERLGYPLKDLSSAISLDKFRQEAQAHNVSPFVRDFCVPTDGAVRTLRGFCQPLRNHDGGNIGSVVQVHDVTESVLLEERMRRMERYLGLGPLAAGLHHEIKNPLAALSLHVQLLEEGLDQPSTSDEVHEMFGVIQSEVTRIGLVLEAFRDFVSLGKLNPVPLDMVELVGQQVKLMTPRLNENNIECQVELPAEKIPLIQGDEIRLGQVLHNLLVNAMEAMPSGGKILIRLSSREDMEGEAIRLEFIDTGSGIPVGLRDRIFDPYFTTKNEGTGMGLALCDKIVRQHGGTLDFQCLTTGTAFRITLPKG